MCQFSENACPRGVIAGLESKDDKYKKAIWDVEVRHETLESISF